MSTDHQSLAARWFDEVWNQGRESAIDELFEANGLAHGLGELGRVAVGPEQFKPYYRQFRRAFDDVRFVVESVLSDGDMFAVRFSFSMRHSGPFVGIAATGKTVKGGGMAQVRVNPATGMIAEAWNHYDVFQILQQIGGIGETAIVQPAAERVHRPSGRYPGGKITDSGRLVLATPAYGPNGNGPLAFAQQWIDLWKRKDKAQIEELVAPDAKIHVGPPLGTLVGDEGYRHYFEKLVTAFPDLDPTLQEAIATGPERVALRLEWTGTHQGPFLSVPATGNKITVHGTAFMRIVHHKLQEAWLSFETAGVLQQIGAEALAT